MGEEVLLIAYWDGNDGAKGAGVYCRWLRGDGMYKVHLLTSKAKTNKLGMKNTPMSEMDGALIAANLLATVVEALQGTQAVKNAMRIGDNNAVLGTRCRDSAPFGEWYRKWITETWEMQWRCEDIGCKVSKWWHCASMDNGAD